MSVNRYGRRFDRTNLVYYATSPRGCTKVKDMRMSTKLIGLAAAALLAGCGGGRNQLPEIAPVDDVPPASSSSSGVDDQDSRGGEAFGDDSLGDTIVYFEYDRTDVLPQFADTLAQHARRLSGQPGLRVRLEGHADERGSREYNIGLGERRAQAVRRILLIQGASAGQISTVSFGEERPAEPGSTESAYERNRRVELVYGK